MNSKQAVNPAKKRFTGDPGLALAVARKAAAEVPAYTRLLKETGRLESLLNGACGIEDLPVTDKDSYCLPNDAGSLVAASLRKDVNGFFFSSGSSGRPFCWPRLKSAPHSLSLSGWLQDTYRVGEKITLTVVALNMDGWIAGMNTALALNQFALEAPFPFMASFPGSDYEQALQTIAMADPSVEQVVVFIYPVAIPYFLKLAQDLGIALPLRKMRFATTGDPFSEPFREHLDELCGAAWPETALASFSYSSADTRVIGTESRVSRALSRLLHLDGGLRRAFGLGENLPNLYISVPKEELPLIEEVDGELVFTRWQPIPIVRYNLHDKGELWDWAETRRLVLGASLPASLNHLREEFARLETAPGDLVALFGRSKALYFYGLYLDERAFSELMRLPKLQAFAPGLFQVAPGGDQLHPRLIWDIELGQPGPDAAATDAAFYRALIDGLTAIYPHFGVNYKNFLQKWDADPAKRVFQLNFHAYPALSGKWPNSRKHRIIRAPGTAEDLP
ncbi:MAG: hypothetical protein A2X35_10455 [Elusimicrobia bacterium GWA2_61_42]|nr:MAG: hypothetical protein A2X35_10455 [Elusimicrobia bacterium GWA2_61_42]OGR74682.1 MAG: hypothetical protein A2X38_02420 [Elusimicrobia bacterium GWC2_61_25]